jgi:hypothetical protein
MSDSIFYLNNASMIQTSSINVTTRQDGSPLQLNDIWIDTNSNIIKQWNGTQWSSSSGKCVLILKLNIGGGGAITVGAGVRIPWNQKVLDTNNAFNLSTFNFVVPRSGCYSLVAKVQTTSALMAGGLETQVNGIVVGDGAHATSFTCGWSTLVLKLNTGDHVSLHQSPAGPNTFVASACNYSIYEL